MKTKLLTIAMTAALMLTAMTKVQAQNFDGPCLPPSHGLDDHQSAFCGVMQVIALSSGWNWYSTNLDITLDDLKDALVATGNTSITISSKDNNIRYTNGRWRGNLPYDVNQMYTINVGTACEITLEGMPLDPSEHPITIKEGSNWIGYPLNETMTPTNAFAGFAVNGDVVQSKDNNARYTGGRWRGSCDLIPGQGYIYKSSQTGDRTLIYPSSK